MLKLNIENPIENGGSVLHTSLISASSHLVVYHIVHPSFFKDIIRRPSSIVPLSTNGVEYLHYVQITFQPAAVL